MQQRFKQAISVFAFAMAVLLFSSPAVAQNAAPVSLQEQLTAQYKLVKMGSDSSGASVVDPGTPLAIQKGGILAVAYSDQSVLSTRYQDGAVHSPNNTLAKGIGFGLKRFGKEQTTHLFKVGDKVYPSKIDVNVAADKVSMNIIACDTCNKTDPPTYNKAQVVFQFAKGSLAKASAAQVEDTIGQLLAISDADDQQGQGQGQGQGGGQQQAQGQQGGQDQQQAAQPEQAEPQTIQKGQTTDEVQAALGKPEKIVNLGAKQIYVYKDLKVTFLNGKVSDVQ